jgi:hypothetical protein
MCRRRSISAEEMIGQQGEEHDIQDDDQEKSDLGLHQHRCLRGSGRSAVIFAALQGSASAKAPTLGRWTQRPFSCPAHVKPTTPVAARLKCPLWNGAKELSWQPCRAHERVDYPGNA